MEDEEKQPIVERLVRKFSRNYATVQEPNPPAATSPPSAPTSEHNGEGVVVLITNSTLHDTEMAQLHTEFMENLREHDGVIVRKIMLAEDENAYVCQGAFDVLAREAERVFLSCPFDSKWVRSCDFETEQVCV